MSAIALTAAQAQLGAWLAASLAVAGNQSYRIGDRELTRADAAEVRQMIEFWRNEVNRLAATANGRRRTRYAVLG